MLWLSGCLFTRTAAVLSLALLLASVSPAQVVTGSILGTVADSSGGNILDVEVRLVSETTGAGRQARTDGLGNFTFHAVPPGAYSITIEHAGFKRYERKNINLPANERIALGEIRLEVGAVTESVTVTAEGAMVQTASSERSGIVTSSQVENLTVISREFTVLATLLPGVVGNVRSETQGAGSSGIFYVQGSRGNANNTLIDGLPSQDLGNGQGVFTFLSIDSVGEVKILTSNMQAEFGRTPGANIQAVTKSGTRDFHGALYWYQRNEKLNANNFFSNRTGVSRPLYRFTTAGFNIGGPITIPGKFNRDRSKLFFFFNLEELREKRPQPLRNVTMPTEMERRGDFSDSRDLNGALITVRDPLTGQPFAGNRIPAGRINPLTQKYLNLLPLPNFFDLGISARRYNYQMQEVWDVPKDNQTVRIDYNIASRTTAYGRFNNWWDERRGFNVAGCAPNWGWLPCSYANIARSGVISATHIFSPTLILEVSTGLMRQVEQGAAKEADLELITRQKSGALLPQFSPENNPLNLVPAASFGGISSPANVTYEGRFPIRGSDTLFTWSGNLTKTHGSHTIKTGIWAERSRNFEGSNGNFTGTFDFGRSVNNPNDSNHPYANALLGNFTSYTESTARPWIQARSTLLEWYAQDSWKVGRRLTLDIGVRFGWAQPYHSFRREDAGFVPDRWDPSKQVRLIAGSGTGANRIGRHPVTGAAYPAPAIGAIAPGVGDPYNGIVNTLTDLSYPQGLRDNSGIKAALRFGFAYDPFGKGRTAIRGGFGMFHRLREQSLQTLGTWSNPPLRENPVIYFGNVNTLLGSTGVTFPSATTSMLRGWPVSRNMNINFGIQQQVGFGTVADISYVSALGRKLMQGRNLNSIPFGTNFNPANFDPSTPGRPYAAAFLRPYPGFNDINLYEYGGNSSYHSLQIAVNRRYARSLQYGMSWTWSKAMNYSDTDTGLVSNLIDPKVWNYSKAGFDRTHVLTLNWVWDLPKAGQMPGGAIARAILNNWQLSGIAAFSSGAPTGIGLGFVQAVDITGSPTDGARVVVLQKPTIARSERTFSRNFNTEAFGPPAVGTFGNAPVDVFRGPGTNNWDISLFKNFPLWSERRKLQFRAEFYNAFNHTNFTGVDAAARFDAAGRQVNTRFGEYTAAEGPRRIQFALRLTF